MGGRGDGRSLSNDVSSPFLLGASKTAIINTYMRIEFSLDECPTGDRNSESLLGKEEARFKTVAIPATARFYVGGLLRQLRVNDRSPAAATECAMRRQHWYDSTAGIAEPVCAPVCR